MHPLTPLDYWQAFANMMWILAPPLLSPPSPLDWLCTCTEPSREPPKQLAAPVQDAFVEDEEFAELLPLPALTDATQVLLIDTEPPVDIITFL